MAITIVSETPGGTKEQYDQVIRELGLGASELAPGQLVHVAGPTASGWQVVNVWESREAADRWMNEKVQPARQKAGMAEPVATVFPVHRLVK